MPKEFLYNKPCFPISVLQIVDLELLFGYNRISVLFGIVGAIDMRDRGKLSERQRNILRYMESYIDTHGFPPTIREIGLATGINSTSVVNYNLNKLVDAGHLSREARACSTRLARPGCGR